MSVYKVEQLPFSVIPACPGNPPSSPLNLRGDRGGLKKDSRRASLAGMTNMLSLWTDSIYGDIITEKNLVDKFGKFS